MIPARFSGIIQKRIPSETNELICSAAPSTRSLIHISIDGIKLQLLHILRGTKLAELYEQAPFPVFSMDEYIELLIQCIRLLPPDMVIHRISGDGPKKLLVAPEWSGNTVSYTHLLPDPHPDHTRLPQ